MIQTEIVDLFVVSFLFGFSSLHQRDDVLIWFLLRILSNYFYNSLRDGTLKLLKIIFLFITLYPSFSLCIGIESNLAFFDILDCATR